MLTSLEINNFQSHKKSMLEFSTGMNVIVGRSDGGKSAVIRALRLVVENRPSGDAYRSNWGGDTSVTVTTQEGDVVTRKKTNTKNSYSLNETEFVAFKQDVPVEIQKALRITDLNIQSQMDSPFLLSMSSGFAAVHFNKCGGLSIIDKSNAAIQRDITRIGKDVEYYSRETAELATQLEEYTFIEACEESVAYLEAMSVRFNEGAGRLRTLRGQITACETARAVVANYKKPVSCEEIDEVLQLYKTKREVIKANTRFASTTYRVEALKQILDKAKGKHQTTQGIDELRELIRESTKIYKVYAQIESRTSRMGLLKKRVERNVAPDSTLLDTVLSIMQSKSEVIARTSRLSKKVAQLETTAEDGKTSATKLKALQEAWKSQLPDVCPLCGSITKTKTPNS